MELKKFIKEEVKRLERKTLLESQKTQIEKELKFLNENYFDGSETDADHYVLIRDVPDGSEDYDKIDVMRENGEGEGIVNYLSQWDQGHEMEYDDNITTGFPTIALYDDTLYNDNEENGYVLLYNRSIGGHFSLYRKLEKF